MPRSGQSTEQESIAGNLERAQGHGFEVFPKEKLVTHDGRTGREVGVLDADANLTVLYCILTAAEPTGRYGRCYSIFYCMTIIAHSHGRLAVTLDRTYGWPVEKYALANGITLIILGPAAVNLAGWLSDRYTVRGLNDAPVAALTPITLRLYRRALAENLVES